MTESIPHPDSNPEYTKSDYIRNSVYVVAKVAFALLLAEGAGVHEVANLGRSLQETIARAFHSAIEDAGVNLAGPAPEAPEFGQGLSDDNPFNPGESP